MKAQLAESYRCAEHVARSRARNFYYSFVVLPPEKRRAFCAVYAFMRYCDDISDGNEPAGAKQLSLQRWRRHLEEAVSGRFDGDPLLPAFRDSIERFCIPPQYFHWIIDGAEMDLHVDSYATFEELYRYCFNVASAVGLVCLQIFGFSDESAKKHAEHCGIAFQLTNILRDIKEDAAMGRVYLPQEDLAKFGYSCQELRRGVLDSRFRDLMAFEAARAGRYYELGRRLLPLIEPNSRPALWAMMEIYGRILKRIVRRRFDVFGKSVRLSGPEKAAIALRALAMRFLPPAG
jgi:phytoene synthase